jgi:O-methyltransferase
LVDITSLAGRVRGRLRPALATGAPEGPTQPSATAVLSDDEKHVIAEVRMLTMVSTERLLANMDAVAYAVERGVPGAIVECGVWRGGSVLAMIRVLQRLGVTDRDVYLYDTFEGMTAPTAEDTSPFERPAEQTWAETPDGTTAWGWAFVKGPVEETMPDTLPTGIAVLRLDTDWYESTLHELTHLYPLMPSGAVLIVDDFGHWEGARRAVEEYFSTAADPILLTRTDYSGRMGVKH